MAAVGNAAIKVVVDFRPGLWDARQLISTFEDGDGIGWHNELQRLWFDDRERTLQVLEHVGNMGMITEPVVIGSDRRVWDGNHRIAVALALSIPVPVKFSEGTNERLESGIG